ncbi:helix-turn-helix domain-containing protein [Streptomyces europaeiscabiei]|uniref:Helix-turn-helix domain-containing protein n=1 Tax=Streptomyces europaeiscabiei TaxID=146819 RepID=A0AAJ2PXW1_9ACTN|nr:helix-turn-helix domain-containing protein [Streptomyces europaeiscabiei]MDX3135769.1 helix-turn-helix domain-containing protein [Streptomyces europaeiscabiei]
MRALIAAASRERATHLPGRCSRTPVERADFIRQTLDRLGDTSNLPVIGTLRDGPLRYSELRHAVPGISQRMLTLTLRQLQQHGLVTRTAHGEVPPRVEYYALTSLGTGLLGPVHSLIGWAADHQDETREHRLGADARRDEATNGSAVREQ